MPRYWCYTGLIFIFLATFMTGALLATIGAQLEEVNTHLIEIRTILAN